jgi:ribosomal-protein-alanine N-acetyltransferase
MVGTVGFLISTEEDRPEGFILLRVTADEAEIISIGVVPAARKKGLASRLLKKSIESASLRNAKKLFIEVAEDNKIAIAFYKTFGFRSIGKRPRYYERSSKNLDAILFSLNISDK